MALNPATYDFDPETEWMGLGVNCQALFHLLGEQTLADIFRNTYFTDVLYFCRERILLMIALGANYPAPATPYRYIWPLAKQEQVRDQLELLIAALHSNGYGTATLEQLVAGSVSIKSAPVEKACQDLKRMGGFLVFNHIPNGMRYRAMSLFNAYGFLETMPQGTAPGETLPRAVGNWLLKSFLTEPARSTQGTATRAFRIARKAKQAGIFRVLNDPFSSDEILKAGGPIAFAEGNGKCCLNGNCVDVEPGVDPDSYYCEEDTAGNCNSLADPCD
jgi:hypothetical protein